MNVSAILLATTIALGAGFTGSALAHPDHGRDHGRAERHHPAHRHRHPHAYPRHPHRYHYRPYRGHRYRHPWPSHDSWYGIHLFFGGD